MASGEGQMPGASSDLGGAGEGDGTDWKGSGDATATSTTEEPPCDRNPSRPGTVPVDEASTDEDTISLSGLSDVASTVDIDESGAMTEDAGGSDSSSTIVIGSIDHDEDTCEIGEDEIVTSSQDVIPLYDASQMGFNARAWNDPPPMLMNIGMVSSTTSGAGGPIGKKLSARVAYPINPSLNPVQPATPRVALNPNGPPPTSGFIPSMPPTPSKSSPNEENKDKKDKGPGAGGEDEKK